jgi:hypothetical protein
MIEKLKGYKKRLALRRKLARQVGADGWYIVEQGANEGIRMPLPLCALEGMLGI